jgi:hypothetical protein
MKTIRNFIVIILLLAGSYWLLSKVMVLPSLPDIFSSKPVVIDETPILIKQIRSIGQLITATSYDEVVVDSIISSRKSTAINSFNLLSPLPIIPTDEKQLVIIGKGKVMAGIDLAKMNDTSIRIAEDTAWCRFPPAEVLDVIINPNDFETFIEKGSWADADVILLKNMARIKMIERAMTQNILSRADKKAKAVLRNFLKAAGFSVVYFERE